MGGFERRYERTNPSKSHLESFPTKEKYQGWGKYSTRRGYSSTQESGGGGGKRSLRGEKKYKCSKHSEGLIHYMKKSLNAKKVRSTIGEGGRM